MPSLYEISVPVFIRALNNLSAILKKAEEYAAEKNIDPNTLASAKLVDDMLPLAFQICTVSNTAKATVERVGKTEPIPMEDNEKTFAEFQERIAKTIKVLEAVDPKVFEGKETAEVEMRGNKFTGQSYILTFALPNFFFHVMAAYAILRKEGVPVGKLDYLKGGDKSS
jgi:hypothetical protein